MRVQRKPKKLSSAAGQNWPLERNGAVSPRNGAVLTQKPQTCPVSFQMAHLTTHMLKADQMALKDTLSQHYWHHLTWQVDGILSHKIRCIIQEKLVEEDEKLKEAIKGGKLEEDQKEKRERRYIHPLLDSSSK